jgi:upstream activation factor subunit UAF30
MAKAKTDATKTPAKTPAKKVASKKAAEPVKASVPAPAPAAPVEENVVVKEDTVESEFSVFFSELQQVSATLTSLRNKFRTLEKKCVRELKAAKKASGKRARRSTNRTPSGFVKPTAITDELATFLNKPSGTEMARTEVTREINNYIRANNLQDPTNGRKINANPALARLLKLTKDDELTYFNLQKYMSPHFPKSGAAAAAASK